MNIIKIITIALLIFTCSLLIEKLLHMSFSLKQLVYQLKSDIGTIVKSLLTEETYRHKFDLQLFEELREIARPYSHNAFDIDVIASFNSGTPFVGIHFVTNKTMDVNELTEATNLLLLKFRRYLVVNSLNWKTFACYKNGKNYVNVYLYYAELPDDIENFKYRYQRTIKEKVDVDYGVLQDDDLNKELNDVN